MEAEPFHSVANNVTLRRSRSQLEHVQARTQAGTNRMMLSLVSVAKCVDSSEHGSVMPMTGPKLTMVWLNLRALYARFSALVRCRQVELRVATW